MSPPSSSEPPGLLPRVREWAGRSLRNRLMLATVALSLTVLLPTVGLSFVLSWRLVREDLASRQSSRAELHASRLAMALQAAKDSLADLASSPLLATALVDAQGWQQYGVPFLRAHRLPLPVEARLALCDFRGRILASGAEQPTLAPLDWVAQVVEEGQWWAGVHGEGADAHLLIIAPVRYAGTGTVEGSVAAELPLGPLGAALFTGGGATRLVGLRGRSLTGDPAAWPDRLATSEPVRLPPPFDALGLRVEVAPTAGAAAGALAWLAGLHLLVALLVLALGLAMSSWLSSRITRPLRDLAEAAWVGSSSPAAGLRIPVQGRDETAMLAVAFNELLDQLDRSRQAVEAGLRSEKQEVEEALRLAHGALEHSNDAITIDEPSGRIAYVNQATCRLLDLPREQVLGRRTFEVFPGLTEARWREVWEGVRTRGRFTSERALASPSGPARWIESAVHLIRLGDTEYCVTVMRDISARRQAEAALRLAGVGTLAAGAAHEINNPLTSVMGNLAYLQDELAALGTGLQGGKAALVAEVRKAAEEALQGAERVRDVVRGLKDFSRPDDMRQEPTDLAEVMRGAVRLARHELSHTGRLTETYQATAPVMASGRRLEQVFVNLLVNAAQALREAGRSGEVAVGVRPGRHGEVVAEVRDDGPGMTPQVRARIFDPFFTTKPVGSGTGLGLAICHGIVSSLGGHIDVESAPGQGSTFRVVLPALSAEGLEAPPASDDAAAGSAAARTTLPPGGRVLVIDDDPLVLRLVARTLAGGPQVVSISDPHEGLRLLLGGESFDLVLCDLMMPGLSGIDLYEALAAERPALAERLVFITGGAFTPRAQAFLAQGVHPCLEKPFGADALRRLLAERLGGGGPVS